MRCTSPKKMSFDRDGKPTFSQKQAVQESIPIPIPCGKCISCMLEYSRQWATRCTHQALLTPNYFNNLFITLTYSDDNLSSSKLIKKDFDLFLERLRYNNPYDSIYACGEYGKKTRRPHWHALLFNCHLNDLKFYSKNKHGQSLYTSKTLDELWPYNSNKFPNKIGFVDYGSAAYVARYHAKGLIHGTKQEQKESELQPISIKTRGLGKDFLKRYWRDVFSYGYVILNGTKHSIPRYYERWFETNYPEDYIRYLTQVKLPMLSRLQKYTDKQIKEWVNHPERQISPWETKAEILRLKTREILLNSQD